MKALDRKVICVLRHKSRDYKVHKIQFEIHGKWGLYYVNFSECRLPNLHGPLDQCHILTRVAFKIDFHYQWETKGNTGLSVYLWL